MVYTLDFTVYDRNKKTAHVALNLPTATTPAQIEDFVEVYAPLLEAVLMGAITDCTVSYGVPLPSGLRTDALDEADREEGAEFVWAAVSGGERYFTRQRIPTFRETKLIVGTNQVNLEDSDVSNLVTVMLAGSSGGVPSDSRGVDITDLWSAEDSFKRYPK